MKPAPKIPSKEYRATALREEFEINSWPPKRHGNWQGAQKIKILTIFTPPRSQNVWSKKKWPHLFFLFQIFPSLSLSLRVKGPRLGHVGYSNNSGSGSSANSSFSASTVFKPSALGSCLGCQGWSKEERISGAEGNTTSIKKTRTNNNQFADVQEMSFQNSMEKKCHGNTPIFFQCAPALPGLHDQVPKVLPNVPLVPGVLGGSNRKKFCARRWWHFGKNRPILTGYYTPNPEYWKHGIIYIYII